MPVWFRLVYSLLPGVPVCQPCLVLPCLALMSSLKTIIWVYVLVCVSLFLPAVCTVTEDQTYKVSGAPSPRFVFHFWKSFVLLLCVLSLAARKSPLVLPPSPTSSRRGSLAGSARVRWPRALQPADCRGYPPPSAAPNPAAHTEPAVRGRWRRRPRLTPARRPAADSSPPDRRWLRPAGSPLTQARRPPLTLAPWIQSIRHSQECRVCLVVPTGTF